MVTTGFYRWISMNTIALSLFGVLFSRSVRLSSGFTHHRSCHSRTGCPFRLDTIIHLCVCVCVAHACRKTSSRDLGQSEMWSAPQAAPSCSGSARLGERNSGNSVWLWAAEASSQQLPSIRGAQRCTGRERDPIRGQAERLESGQSYCPPLLTYTAPGLGLHHTHPVFPPLPVYLAASIFLVILIVFFSCSLGRRWARQRKKQTNVLWGQQTLVISYLLTYLAKICIWCESFKVSCSTSTLF